METLEDSEMTSISRWSSLPLPAPEASSAKLSFEALAKLFAHQRPSLIDADFVSIETRRLVAGQSAGVSDD